MNFNIDGVYFEEEENTSNKRSGKVVAAWTVVVSILIALIIFLAYLGREIDSVRTALPTEIIYCTYAIWSDTNYKGGIEAGETVTWALEVASDYKIKPERRQLLENGGEIKLPVSPDQMSCVNRLENVPPGIPIIGKKEAW